MKEFIEKAFGIKDSELEGWEYNIPEGYTASIENGKIIVKKEEGEDEKIRKALIDYFDNANKVDENPLQLYGIHTDKVLAWLEKQGEQEEPQFKGHYTTQMQRNVFYKVGDWIIRSAEGFKHNIYLVTEVKDYYVCEDLKGRRVTFTFNDVHKNFRLWNISDAKDGDVLVDEDNNIGLYRGEKDDFWESYIYLGCNNYLYGPNIGGYHEHKNTKPATKEQCDSLFAKMKETGYKWDAEKKELNENEPKFKVGDWVVREYEYTDIITINQVVDVKRIDDEHFGYTLDDETYFSGSWECSYHLWTIKDAKDGDVLVTVDGKRPFIYKGCLDPNHPDSPVAYCGIDTEGYFCKGGDNFDHWWTDVKVQPATKEQRDLLFSKMKEAGYEWNAEKKELKKIHVIDEGKSEMDYCFTKMMNGEKVSPTWGEEDEEMFDAIIADIQFTQKAHNHEVNQVVFEREINWFKTLKERMKGE